MFRLLPAAFALLVVSLIATSGCTPKKDGDKDKGKKTAAVHDHPETGPHKGALVEWGDEEYHLEFTVDHDKKQTTVYVLDDKAAKPSPIEVETLTLLLTHVKPNIEITLKADPDKDDPKGKSSRFVAVHDELAKKIDFKGEISGKVGTKPYTGTFVEKDDHKHDEPKKKKS